MTLENPVQLPLPFTSDDEHEAQVLAAGALESPLTAALHASCEVLRAEAHSLRARLAAAEAFHAHTVAQRDAAWREAEALRVAIRRWADARAKAQGPPRTSGACTDELVARTEMLRLAAPDRSR